VYNGGKYHLENWGVAVLRGEDRYRLSRSIDAAKLRGEGADKPRLAA